MKTLKLKKTGHHGNFKSVAVFPDRWPPIESGTEVTLVKVWANLYGIQVRVKGPNGNHYDIDPECFENGDQLLRDYSLNIQGGY